MTYIPYLISIIEHAKKNGVFSKAYLLGQDGLESKMVIWHDGGLFCGYFVKPKEKGSGQNNDFNSENYCNPIDVIKEYFNINEAQLESVHIKYASYIPYATNKSGKALIIFEKNGKLYEVNGQHDSKSGFLSQWEPEETSKKFLLSRLNNPDSDIYGLFEEVSCVLP
jgi:hypothetical protein